VIIDALTTHPHPIIVYQSNQTNQNDTIPQQSRWIDLFLLTTKYHTSDEEQG
jgi:hypothetical protein